MIRDGNPACRLKPASPAVPAASAKDENKKNNDDKRLGIHDVKPFQYDRFGLGFSTISAFRQRSNDAEGGSNPPAEANYHNSFHGGLLTP